MCVGAVEHCGVTDLVWVGAHVTLRCEDTKKKRRVTNEPSGIRNRRTAETHALVRAILRDGRVQVQAASFLLDTVSHSD